MNDTDHVVLLDDEGRAIGTAPKSSVHGTDTALHLAFSCHVDQRRRPGARDSPRTGQDDLAGRVEQLLLRTPAAGRARAHRGAPPRRVRARASRSPTSSSRCPCSATAPSTPAASSSTRCARSTPRAPRDEPVLNPLEVVDAKWVDPAELRHVADRRRPWAFSPWLVLQAEQLHLFDAEPALQRRRRHDPAPPPARRIDDAIDGVAAADPSTARRNWAAASRRWRRRRPRHARAASGSGPRWSRHPSTAFGGDPDDCPAPLFGRGGLRAAAHGLRGARRRDRPRHRAPRHPERRRRVPRCARRDARCGCRRRGAPRRRRRHPRRRPPAARGVPADRSRRCRRRRPRRACSACSTTRSTSRPRASSPTSRTP